MDSFSRDSESSFESGITDLKHLTRILERRGFAIQGAGNAGAALEALRAARFDLIVLDNDLPDMMGLEPISKFSAISHAPIIMISGVPTEFNRANRTAGPTPGTALSPEVRLGRRVSTLVGTDLDRFGDQHDLGTALGDREGFGPRGHGLVIL